MSTHPSKLTGQLEGMSIKELALQISQLRYDVLAKFISNLATNLGDDGAKDKAAGRVILGAYLHNATRSLRKVEVEIVEAWGVCEPFMQGDETKK